MPVATRKIPLARVRRHDDLQMRVGGLLPGRIELYAEMREAGHQFPAIRVVEDAEEPGWYWLVDGNYRVASAESVGQDSHDAEVVEVGGFDRARWLATGVNATHGVPRDNETLDRAVEVALRLEPGQSNRMLARHVGCTDKRVARVRRELGLDEPGERVGLDGRKRPVGQTQATPDALKEEEELLPVSEQTAEAVEGTIRKLPHLEDDAVAEIHQVDPAVVGEIREQLAQEEAELSQSREGGVDDDVPEEATSTPVPTAKMSQLMIRDKVGLWVPAELQDVWMGVWSEGERLRAMLRQAAEQVAVVAVMPGGEAYAHALEHRESQAEGPAKEVRLSSHHLRSAQATLASNLPWASACPDCVRVRGRRSCAGCRFCSGRGWLPRSVWENFNSHERELALAFVKESEEGGESC